jgi:hypothetical protein
MARVEEAPAEEARRLMDGSLWQRPYVAIEAFLSPIRCVSCRLTCPRKVVRASRCSSLHF